MKLCIGCNLDKSLSDFWGDKKAKDKKQAYCISCKGEQRKVWRENGGRKYHRDYMRRVRQETREKLIDLLGAKCKGCGIEDRRVLQIDHIEDGGALHRMKFGGLGGLKYYQDMLKSTQIGENKYQILCANCNYIKAQDFHKLKMTKL